VCSMVGYGNSSYSDLLGWLDLFRGHEVIWFAAI
jgi:hypothetical protein